MEISYPCHQSFKKSPKRSTRWAPMSLDAFKLINYSYLSYYMTHIVCHIIWFIYYAHASIPGAFEAFRKLIFVSFYSDENHHVNKFYLCNNSWSWKNLNRVGFSSRIRQSSRHRIQGQLEHCHALATNYMIENNQLPQHLAEQRRNNQIQEHGISEFFLKMQFNDQWDRWSGMYQSEAIIQIENLPRKSFYDKPFQAFETFCSTYFDTFQSFFPRILMVDLGQMFQWSLTAPKTVSQNSIEINSILDTMWARFSKKQ